MMTVKDAARVVYDHMARCVHAERVLLRFCLASCELLGLVVLRLGERRDYNTWSQIKRIQSFLFRRGQTWPLRSYRQDGSLHL